MKDIFASHAARSREEVAAALRQIPMHPETVALLHSLHQAGVEVIVLSDANTFFIETVLEVTLIFVLFFFLFC